MGIAVVMLLATKASAGIIGDHINGHFGPPMSPNHFYNSEAVVQDPGEEFRGVAFDFGTSGFVEAIADFSEGYFRLGFDTANMTVHSGINTNFRFVFDDLDFGPGLGIKELTFVGTEGGGLWTGGGPANWMVSHTNRSITLEHVAGWSMFPETQVVAVYAIETGPIPEPATAILMVLGAAAALPRRRNTSRRWRGPVTPRLHR